MTSGRRIRVMLVDDHAVVREGYRSLLEKQPGLQVAGEAADGAEAYVLFQECKPDVVIMDLSLSGQGGLETISRIRKRQPDASILVFSMHQNPGFALQATRAGARGYITKSSLPDVLIRAVYDVYEGKHALSADIAQVLALEKIAGKSDALAELTVREFEILRMLVEARSAEEIANTLRISHKTVLNSHYLIKRKLGVVNDIELTRLAIQMNVINLLELSDRPEGE